MPTEGGNSRFWANTPTTQIIKLRENNEKLKRANDVLIKLDEANQEKVKNLEKRVEELRIQLRES